MARGQCDGAGWKRRYANSPVPIFLRPRVKLYDAEAANLTGARRLRLCRVAHRTALPLCIQHGTKEDISTLPVRGFCFFCGRSNSADAACGPNAFAQFDPRPLARFLDQPSGHHIAHFVLSDVFVQSGGNQLLHAEPYLPLFQVEFEHLRLHNLTDVSARPADARCASRR